MTTKEEIKRFITTIVNVAEIIKYDELMGHVDVNFQEIDPNTKLTALAELIQANQIKRLEYTINRSTIRPFYMAANCSLM